MSLLNDAATWVRAHPGRVVFPDALDMRTFKAAKAWVLNMRKEVAATRRRSRRLAARVTGEALP